MENGDYLGRNWRLEKDREKRFVHPAFHRPSPITLHLAAPVTHPVRDALVHCGTLRGRLGLVAGNLEGNRNKDIGLAIKSD